MAIIRAIVDGERDARQLAQLRDGRCHKSEEEIAEQLSGRWRGWSGRKTGGRKRRS